VAKGEPVVNYPLEGSLVTDPNEYRYWLVSYFPVYGPDGDIQGITAASQEITQQKNAEKALIEAEKLAVVGRLASSIAHEINNPLESVTNVIYIMRSINSSPEMANYLEIADRELRRVAAITSQTLRFHKQATFPTEVLPCTLVDSVLTLFQGRLINAGIQVERRDHVENPVKCFEGEIRQVLSNFIGNAIDAMQRDGGRLCIRSREGTDLATGALGIVITIADTGRGMDSTVKAQLFKPFFTTKGLGGTGLGLWISKGIIEKHGGKLFLKSSQGEQCRGTIVRFFLPYEG
jgi:signal transduction histidine kinase